MLPDHCKTSWPNSRQANLRTLIVDNSELVLARLRSFLEGCSEVAVIAAAKNGRQALDLVRLHQPDLVVMVRQMPGMNDVEAVSRIASEFPKTRVVRISADSVFEHDSRRRAAQFLAPGTQMAVDFSAVLEGLFGSSEPRPVPQSLHAQA